MSKKIMFKLHSRLEQDSLLLGSMPLSQIRLMNDQQYPWLILIPMCSEITEIHQLEVKDQQQLMTESCFIAACIQDSLKPDKLNWGALGNIVPQLHLHIIARFQTDAAWPGPIWGVKPNQSYPTERLTLEIHRWKKRLNQLKAFMPS